MKKQLFSRSLLALMVLFVFAISISSNVFAHAPRSIHLTYDKDSQTVSGLIQHRGFYSIHLINRVYVRINNVQVEELRFGGQSTSLVQNFSVKLPETLEDDVIEVDAYCNLIGHLKCVIPKCDDLICTAKCDG